jgi:ribonuclease P protein component
MLGFKKKEIISSKSDIKDLFNSPRYIKLDSLNLIWKYSSDNSRYFVNTLIVVPKKNISKAVDRNRIKRVIRESYRKNKNYLIEVVKKQNKKINIAFIYQDLKIKPYTKIETEMKDIFVKLKKEL